MTKWRIFYRQGVCPPSRKHPHVGNTACNKMLVWMGLGDRPDRHFYAPLSSPLATYIRNNGKRRLLFIHSGFIIRKTQSVRIWIQKCQDSTSSAQSLFFPIVMFKLCVRVCIQVSSLFSSPCEFRLIHITGSKETKFSVCQLKNPKCLEQKSWSAPSWNQSAFGESIFHKVLWK